MKTRALVSTLAALLMLWSTPHSASANTLPLTGSNPVPPDVFGPPSPGGTLLGDTTLLHYTTPVYSGFYESQVFTDPNNPLCANCLAFHYMFTNDASSADAIHRATVGDFAGFTTDVGYDSTSAGTAPTTVDRQANGAGIGFNFPMNLPLSDGIAPGHQSTVLVVFTNATNFTLGTLSLINRRTADLNGFQPTVVPEPGTLLLLGSGLAGVAASRYARKRRA